MEVIYFWVPWLMVMGWWYICIGRGHKIRIKLIQFTYDKEGRSYPEWWNYVEKKKKWFGQQPSYGQVVWKLLILRGPQKFIKGEFAEKFLDRMEYY